MPLAVRVTVPFGEYAVGQQITDSEKINEILGSEQSKFVVSIQYSAPFVANNAQVIPKE